MSPECEQISAYLSLSLSIDLSIDFSLGRPDPRGVVFEPFESPNVFRPFFGDRFDPPSVFFQRYVEQGTVFSNVFDQANSFSRVFGALCRASESFSCFLEKSSAHLSGTQQNPSGTQRKPSGFWIRSSESFT